MELGDSFGVFWFLCCFSKSWLTPFPFLPHLHTPFFMFSWPPCGVGLGPRNLPNTSCIALRCWQVVSLGLGLGLVLFIKCSFFLWGCLEFLSIATVFIILTHFLTFLLVCVGVAQHNFFWGWEVGVEVFGFCAIGFWEVWVLVAVVH